MIENQLKKQGLRLGDIRFVLHTHLRIDHAGKDDLFPMNTTVVINRRELEYSVSGLMHPQYPAVDIKHLIDRLHQGRFALPRSRDNRADRIDVWRHL
jgi:glyoxylase-like metal-dependent hydrolase (beta-lactamase superfamily II)